MALNTIEAAKNFQTVLDQQMIMEAATGFMEVNAGDVVYDGGDTVKIPTLSMQGLAAYDREEGYNKGTVSLSYKDYNMTQDRGRQFTLDAMTVNESNFVANATKVMAEFQRTRVIPEVDAYRISKITALAKQANKVTQYNPAEADVLKKLDADLYNILDIIGDANDLVILMSYKAQQLLNNNEKFAKQVDASQFQHGAINTRVKMYNDIPIINVTSDRMKSAFVFQDGKTTGQEAGGFKADTAAKGVNWIIMSRRSPIAVSKTDTMRIFDPMTYQKANAWAMDYRKFHDVWVPNERLAAVWANIGA